MGKRLLSLFLFFVSVSASFGATFYWVGGSGSWTDINHWSYVSGGRPAGSIPGPSDDAIFDGFSLSNTDVVRITSSVSCGSLDFSSSFGSLYIDEGAILAVNGNIAFSGNTRIDGGALMLSGSGNHHFKTSAALIETDIYLNSTGKYNLSGTLKTSGNFILQRGEFNATGSVIQINSFVEDGKKFQVNLGESKLVVSEDFNQRASLRKKISAGNASVYHKSASGIQVIDSVTVTVNSPLCNGVCNGSITIDVHSMSGGPYGATLSATSQNCTFNLTPTATGATGACSGLCNDTFILTVTDSSDNYQFIDVVTIQSPPAMAASFNFKRRPTCFGDCNGWIKVNVFGGSPPYSYSWNTVPSQTGDTAVNLCAGNYSVTVTDNNGCSQVFNTNLTQPTPIIPAASSSNVVCFGDCDGTAGSSPSGGHPPNYSFSWTSTAPPFSANTQNITNLCPGTYILTVTDDSLCTGSDTVTITEPPLLQLNPASTNISCGGACDGTASISPSGGTAPYTVNWSNGMTGNSLSNLCPDVITVVVTDANGCSDSVTFTITEPSTLFANAGFTDVLCFNACDGTAFSNPAGGTAPYSFSWSNGAFSTGLSDTITNLCPGTFIVTVTDANGCQDEDTVVISEPSLLTAVINSTNVSCNGLCDGSAGVTIAGGSPSYTILWSDGSTGSSISGLCPDTISVLVTDSNMCVAADTIIITQPPVLTVTMADDTIGCAGACNGVLNPVVSGGTPGYSLSWSNGGNGTGLCVGTYSVTVTDTNGCTASATAEVVNPTPITLSLSATPATCFGSCDATATVAASGGFPPYTVVWCNGQTGTTATGLCGNTSCTVTVTDAQGCTSQQSINLTQPSPITTSMSVTNILCEGECTGSATVTPAGGTGPYIISWNTIPATGGNTISGLCDGSYIATITDANGCVFVDTAIVAEPTPVLPNLSITNVSCNGLCDGSASVAPSGGVPPYTVTWSNGLPPGNSQSNLCAGMYSVIISDANNCSDTIQVNITQPLLLNASVVNINASCGSVCDGSASVIAAGGTPPYTYLWNTPTPQANDTATNLCVGNYSVTVTDSNGCTISLPVTITPVVFISINSTGGQPSCFGACDGQATAVASGGATPYTYSWSNGQNTQSATGLCGNTMYYVTATDANGCSNTDSIMLSQPNPVQVSFSVTNATCGNVCNGSVTASASGGNLPYSFSWSNGQTGPTASNLCGGTFYVTVTDGNGCSTIDSVLILAPSNILPNEVIVDATCNNSDGSITLSPTGGTAPYGFQWLNPVSTANPLNNIPAGVYSVIISDAATCSDTFALVVNNINGPVVSVNTSSTSCPGGCDGTATANPSGGTPGYTFSWSNGQSVATATNLCAGFVSVSVTDALGCVTSVVDTVPEPLPIVSNEVVNDITCNAFCDGSVILSPTGGTAPYTFSWSTGQTTDSIGGLCPGSYIVVITDANLCTATDTFVVGNQTQIIVNANTTNVDCFGGCNGSISLNPTGGNPPYNYAWSPSGSNTPNISGLCAGTYSVVVTDNLGCNENASFTITEPTQLNLVLNTSNIACFGQTNGTASVSATGGSGGYTYFWLPGGQTTSSVNGLPSGSYSVTVCDSAAGGCCITQNFTITEPTLLSVASSGTDLTCFNSCDGTLNAAASGGTGPYTYNWMPGNLSGSIQNNLCAGTYIVTATDANGCTSNDTVVLSQPALIVGNQSISQVSCFNVCDGAITLNPTGGSAPYTFNWSPGNITTQNLTGLCAGTYSVTITDANGCTRQQSFTLNQPAQIAATFTVSPATCGLIPCDGSVNLIPFGGVGGPYSVIWNTGATGTNLTGLCAGLYTAFITDASGCMDSVQVPLNNLNGPVLTSVVTDAVCFDDCNGTGVITATGPNNPFSFQWTPGGYTSDSVTTLCAGNYNVQVTDTLGCISFENLTINEPAPVLGNPSITNATCTGVCDGAITMNPTGGSGVYTHSWNTGATTSTLSNLCAGTYIDSISDANGCFGVDTIQIIVPNPLMVNGSVAHVSCNSACDGNVFLSISGGTAPFSIAWSNGINQTSNGNTALGNFCAGTFSAVVTDANGCTGSFNFNINEPAPLSAGATVNNISCNAACDGNISLNVTGGTMPYSITWSDGTTANSINNLCPGNYAVNITDANGCQVNQSFVITQPAVLTASVLAGNVSCNGSCDGTAIVVPSGGTAPFFFQWLPGGFTNDTLTGLCAGTYTVQVTDSSGCTFNSQVVITEPASIQPNFTTTTPPCGVCNGVVSASPSGGSGPAYTFVWNTGATSATVNNLCAGIYSVDITDVAGCTQNFSLGLSNVNGPGVTTSTVNPGCNSACDGSISTAVTGTGPFTYSWSPGGSTADSLGALCAGIYLVQVTDATGCITVETDTLQNPPAIIVSPTITDATCGSCNGTANVNVSGGIAPYNYLWSTGSSGSSETGLCAGVYSLQVSDSSGCSVNSTINISNTGGPTGEQIVTTPETCSGSSDGTATVTGVGGTPPYSYLWIPGGQNTSSVTGLAAGNYSVQITDANGCSRTASVTIQAASQILANDLVTNATCGACDGGLTLNPSGGAAPYSYAWSGGLPATASQTNLCAGLYSVTITDANGCSRQFTIPVNTTNAPAVTASSTDASCGGACDGTALVTASGGAGGFTYLWSTGSTQNSLTGLCTGVYTVQATDAAGCAGSAQVTVNEPNQLAFSIPNVIDVSCPGSCDGSATVIPSGGTLPYTINWNPTGQTTQTASGICAGVHIVSVTDANGCAGSQSVTVNSSTIINASFTTSDATCGQCDGTATVSPSGGVAPYSFLWADGSTGASVNGLCAGVHAVTITDNSGCSQQFTVSINNSSAPVVNVTSLTNASCNGNSDGSASISISGGVTPYNITWVPGGQTSTSVSGLTAGTYQVQVQDSLGCQTSVPVLIAEPSALNSSVVINNANCGQCNGNVVLLMSGGAQPYSYAWSNGLPAASSQTGLCPGVYTVTITDANGCSVTETIPVSTTNGPVLAMTSTDLSCNGICDGTATVSASGGSGTYNYSWSPGGQTSATLNALCAGNYYVQVTDAVSGCITINMVQVEAPDSIYFSQLFTQDASCGGDCDGVGVVMPSGGTMPYTYTWSAGGTGQSNAGLCAGNGSVSVTDANGCAYTQNFSISEPPPIVTDTLLVTRPSCSNVNDGAINISVSGGNPGYTFNWSSGQTTEDLNNIGPGTYTVTVTDASGCVDSLVVQLLPLLPIEVSGGNDTAYCEGLGPVILSGTGATSYQWLDANGNVISSSANIQVNPGPGTHTFILLGTNGGCTDADTVLVTVYPGPVADAGEDASVLQGQSTVIGGNPSGPAGSTFSWQPSEGLSSTTAANPTSTPQQDMVYTLTVTTAQGCIGVDTVEVIILPDIIFPDGITPNGDGKNDLWIIDNIHLFPGCIVEVYNRWGQLIFSSPGYVDKWDGTYEGKLLPVGTYYYVIDLKDERYEPFTGPITIMR